MTKKTTTSPLSSSAHFHKRGMRSERILVMIGIIMIGISVIPLTSLLGFIGLIIMGVGIYQYSVAQSKYHVTALQQKEEKEEK
ncbi:MAG TPA: hypothetical protein VFR94_03765 [Nitrososphaeraceae archaeon]|nr:hypothetical protein [Nitrososphaeraceae archaeon]